jgi:hypothetical protein
MGRRSCSPYPESAWGRVMMAPPVDVVGPCPRLGDVEAPPRRRPSAEARAESEPWGRAKQSSSSSGAEPESEPWGRADRSSSSSGAEPESEPWGRAKRSSSSSGAEPESEPWGRAKRSSLSCGAEPESEPWGRAKRSSSSSGAEPDSEPWGRAKRSFLWRLRPDLAACQPHSVEWHNSRSGAGVAVLLSDRSVER